MPPGSSATIIMSCFFEEGLEAKKKYLEAILFYALFFEFLCRKLSGKKRPQILACSINIF